MRKDLLQNIVQIGILAFAFSATSIASEPVERAAPRGTRASEPVQQFPIFKAGYPRAYFFRQSEGYAARPQISYEQWDRTFSRLMGIEGKVLDEELPGRSLRNVEFFTRFKRQHPDQLVLLHYNANARDPQYQRENYFAGHWIYWNGARITSDVPAESGETDIHVNKPQLFRMNMGRFEDRNEDIGLCTLDEQGHPNWHESEQVQLVSIDHESKIIRVRRGCYGTKPRALPAGKAYAAAHVCRGPWGGHANLMWLYNYSTRCPKDRQGRRCADVHVAELAELFGPKGKLATFDGIEFDVLRHKCAAGPRVGRNIDCDGDGRPDNAIFKGINTYGVGVVKFCKKLQELLDGRKLILADSGGLGAQRCFGILNGIESEGWPHLSDWEITGWSEGLNRHLFWNANARPPVFNYINHKFTTAGKKPGQRIRPEVDFNIHRLVLATAQCMDAAICQYYTPPVPPDGNVLLGIWDELWMGTEKRIGWLGKPLGPTVRLALKSPDLLDGVGVNELPSLLPRCKGDNVRLDIDGNRLRVSGKHDKQRELRFRLCDVPCSGPDLFVSVTMTAKPMSGYPPQVARLCCVGIAKPTGKLVTEDVPYLDMWTLKQKDDKRVRFMTYVNDKPFTSGFYFSQISSRTIDLAFSFEGNESVWISDLTIHACPDVLYREFENGLVLANPARHEYVFDMDALFAGQKFRRLHGSPQQDPGTNNGSLVTGRLILQERDGLFLVRPAP